MTRPAGNSFWPEQVTLPQKRTFWACYAGWALDALDVQMFSLAIPAILASWHISKAAAGSASSVSLVASAIGGWLMGAATDRFGRVRMLQASILGFSAFTLLSAFAQNLPQLLVLRAFQGFAFGGEWAVGSVIVAESIRAGSRGRVMAVLQSGWAVGWGLAVILYGIVFSFLQPAEGWRALFLLGILPAFLVLYVRRSIPEPAPFARIKKPQLNPLAIFRRNTLRITLLGGLLGVGAHGGYYALTTWLPTFLKNERHLSVLGTSSYLAVIIVAFGCGCLACSQLLDRIGRRPTILLFSICCVISVVAMLLTHISNLRMLLLGFPLGFFAAGIPASMGALFSELYPTGVRGSGVGFCYNFGRVVSAAFPVLVGRLSVARGLGFAIGVDAAAAYSLVVVAVLLLPETRSRQLQESTPTIANMYPAEIVS